MAGFYIKQVIAVSEKKGNASVTFGPGLNIIQGRSDTGKTCVAKCIDFIFGSKEVPFKDNTGYDAVIMKVVPNGQSGEISFRRNVGTNKVMVISDVSGIETGTYNIRPNKNEPDALILNDIWLILFGIPAGTEVINNARFEKKRLTWRNLLRAFYLDENRVDDADSILQPAKGYMQNTLFLSSLLYLLDGKSFSETDAKEKAEITKARRNAVRSYVNHKMSSISDRKTELEKELHIYTDANVEQQISRLTAALDNTRKQIESALTESQDLLQSILSAEERRAECSMLLSRYQKLGTQYKSDIRRLSLIVDGELAYQEVPKNHVCPYCQNEMAPQVRSSYLTSARGELDRIVAQASGLEESTQDVKDRKADIEAELSALEEKYKVLEARLQRDLRPKESSLQEMLEGYSKYLQICSELDMIASLASDFSQDLTDLEKQAEADKESNKIEYHPKEYFDDDFGTLMSAYADTILQECHYADLTKARFNFTDFDIEVNGEKKGNSHGKGYRSYLNTVMIMTLRHYLAEHAKYDPRLFIVDTPLHGFDDGVDDHMPDSMRAGLFNYFINHQDEGQLIIIENLDHIPDLDYASSGAMVETFTKRKEPGERYGFLNDVY